MRHLPGLLLLGCLLSPAEAPAQSGIERDLRTLSPENARAFVQPLSRGLVLAMGGGLFDGAMPLDPLAFEVGARVSGALLGDRSRSFDAAVPNSVQWDEGPLAGTFTDPYRPREGSVTGPTVAGEGPGIVLEPDGDFREAILAADSDPSQLVLRLPEGRDLPAAPHPVFHGSVGVGLGTEISIRFLPELEVDREIGGMSGMGFAVRHSLARWLEIPIDLSLLAARQRLHIGSYADGEAIQFGILASHRMGPLSLFATGFLRRGSMDVTYRVANPDENPGLPADGTVIRFTETVDSEGAVGLGARLQLLVLNVAGQYSFDDDPLVTLKVGFGTP